MVLLTGRGTGREGASVGRLAGRGRGYCLRIGVGNTIISYGPLTMYITFIWSGILPDASTCVLLSPCSDGDRTTSPLPSHTHAHKYIKKKKNSFYMLSTLNKYGTMATTHFFPIPHAASVVQNHYNQSLNIAGCLLSLLFLLHTVP